MIIEWCKKYGHPYAVDSLYGYLTDPPYKLEEAGYFIEKDAAFSIDEFMQDLERFYQAMRMQFAFEQMCLGNDKPALSLYEDGKHFAGLPFFEKFRYDPEEAPEDKGTSADQKEKHEGAVMSCPFCGEAVVRRSNRSVICGKPERIRARKRMSKQNSRNKKKLDAQEKINKIVNVYRCFRFGKKLERKCKILVEILVIWLDSRYTEIV